MKPFWMSSQDSMALQYEPEEADVGKPCFITLGGTPFNRKVKQVTQLRTPATLNPSKP